ncbi:HAD-like protein [Eremomyces bilateralis CBS 781.70]|uniref:HAD-like protein n=1 Tax=Eremomyces bilateralis CBS 781.70 TaxID=1392243 RepID=A0A6G1FSU1_9PEZI|nr:HAD-like protein [Eremomyces bilateralis CBS 781.70]KAF1808935.1 HAD-like protein [Eremomyces bilateralis CBS 781.70]
MASTSRIVLAFDLFGTILSTDSVAEKLSGFVGEEKAKQLATVWRQYHLSYSWRLTCMGLYEDFSVLLHRAFLQTLADQDVHLDDSAIKSVLAVYDSLAAYPDVEPALRTIQGHPNIQAVLFSNGTPNMVASSLSSSSGLAGLGNVFEQIVSVDEIKTFKPAKATYDLVAKRVGFDPGKAEDMARIWLVSSNPFDIVGARSAGMQAAWVDRLGKGWTDALVAGEKGKPTVILRSLEEIFDADKGVEAMVKRKSS